MADGLARTTRVAIIGANGQLGTELVKAFADSQVCPLTHADIEVTDLDSIARTLGELRPDVVVNTAAFHRVDDIELDPRRAFEVNALGVRNLALVCRELDAALVHFSTDYVFSGDKGAPYGEDDLPGPVNAYGASKLAGEYLLRYLHPRHYLLRTTGLFGLAGSSGKGGNFVETMLRLQREGRRIRVVDDQVLSPTYCPDLARKVRELVATGAYGLYHVTSSGYCSWYEFARKIFELLDLEVDLTPQSSAEAGSRARRPAFSALRHDRLQALGMDDMLPWDEGLRRYLLERAAAGRT